MNKKISKKIIIIVWVIFFLFIVFAIYQLIALNNIKAQNIKIEQIRMNKNLELMVSGAGELINPGFIPVTIRRIDYVGYIKDKQVFNGTIHEITIPAKSTVQFSFIATSAWVPDEETIIGIFREEHIILVVETKSSALYLFFFTLLKEEQTSIDVTQQLKPYIDAQLNSLEKRITEFLA